MNTITITHDTVEPTLLTAVAISTAAETLRKVGFTVVVEIKGAEPVAPSIPEPRITKSETALERFPELANLPATLKAQLDGFDPYFPVFGPPEPVVSEPTLAERWAARAVDPKPMPGDADLLDEPAKPIAVPEPVVEVIEPVIATVPAVATPANETAAEFIARHRATKAAPVEVEAEAAQPNGERLVISRHEALTLAPSADEAYEARSWLEDNVELIEVDRLSNGQVRKAIDGEYKGGWAQFAIDRPYRRAEPTSWPDAQTMATLADEVVAIIDANEPVVDTESFATPVSDDPRIAKLHRQKADILRKLHTASSSVHEATLSAALAKINEELAA